MCLIVVAWQTHPDYPLVVAANRDEFYERPTQDAAPWPEAPHIIAGLDLQAGGTWMGISTTTKRFAAITNVREPGVAKGELSRGGLTKAFLLGNDSAENFLAAIDQSRYSGYNLLLSDGREFWYHSNRDGGPHRLQPGVYAVSNHLLETPWPKLVSARARFVEALPKLPERKEFFAMLADDQIVPDENLPQTGVPMEWERLLSAIFVKSETYGTRASTVVVCDKKGGVSVEERRFGVRGISIGKTQFKP